MLDKRVGSEQKGGMKKLFSLTSERHQAARVVEKVKSEIRKYLKRERGKKLDEEFDFWGFDCRTGKVASEATICHEKEIGKALDEALALEWPTLYIEIIAKPVKRTKRE